MRGTHNSLFQAREHQILHVALPPIANYKNQADNRIYRPRLYKHRRDRCVEHRVLLPDRCDDTFTDKEHATGDGECHSHVEADGERAEGDSKDDRSVIPRSAAWLGGLDSGENGES